jgi:ribosomal-protein-serine acetyltransferase
MHRVTELTDGEIALRPVTISLVDDLTAAVQASRAELSPWMPWCRSNTGHVEMAEFVRGARRAHQIGTEHHFAIHAAIGGAFLGMCGITRIQERVRSAELGYWLRSDATGEGYATKSVRLLASWAFEELGLERIAIIAAVTNLASQAVASRAGATREGITRCGLVIGDGSLSDAVTFSLIRSDLNSRSTQIDPPEEVEAI